MSDFPGLTKPSLLERELPATFLLAGPPCVAALVATAKLDGLALYGSIFVFIWLVVGTVLKVLQAWRKDAKLEQARGPERLLVCLYLLREAMLVSRGLSPWDDEHAGQMVRVTIHRLEREELVQLFDYIGGRAGAAPTRGRRRSCRAGVVGRAYTNGEPAHFRRANHDFEAYKKEMRERWSMLPGEAEQLDSERLSHFAVPIGHPSTKEVHAVMFADSNDADFFSPRVQELVIAHCVGLAKYVWQPDAR